MSIYCSIAVYLKADQLVKMITDNQYMDDCENTTRLIESLMATLKTMRCEMQAEVFRNISESSANNTNMDDKLIGKVDPVFFFHPSLLLICKEAPTSELQLIGALREVVRAVLPNRISFGNHFNLPQGKPTRTLVEKNLKEKTVESVRISGPPVLKSELAKQWIREVAKKTF
uniref:Uncharacterized protein n=1 Tax=Wuchereria bancrofti TaxID=6293 RepID=A0AAF5Q5M6_WUCBA